MRQAIKLQRRPLNIVQKTRTMLKRKGLKLLKLKYPLFNNVKFENQAITKMLKYKKLYRSLTLTYRNANIKF